MADSALIPWLRSLAVDLAAEAPSARSAASRLGGAVENPGHDLPLIIRPEIEGIERATAANRAEGEELSHVSLELADSAHLSVADLTSEFGTFMRPPAVHAGSPVRLVFSRAAEGSAGAITLIAEVVPGAGDINDAPVKGINLRFDAAD